MFQRDSVLPCWNQRDRIDRGFITECSLISANIFNRDNQRGHANNVLGTAPQPLPCPIVSPRTAVLVGLVALGPVVSYVLLRADPIALIAGVNVVIVTGALVIAFRTIVKERRDVSPPSVS